jgi:homoserine O-acetyltransferase
MDEYDIAAGYPNLETALERVESKVLIVAISSDWLFPPQQSMELANSLLYSGKHVSYCRLFAPHGHDTFLIDVERLTDVLRAFLPWVADTDDDSNIPTTGEPRQGTDMSTTKKSSGEFSRLQAMIRPGSRVLDLGCGSGRLLSELKARREVTGVGMEIDIDRIIDVLNLGHDVYQVDIDEGLSMLPDRAYDYAILSETLQVVRRPRDVVREMLRVAREGIVSFPNFAKWRFRVQLGMGGRMPKGSALPFEWYDTPNIHLFTLRDFVDLCEAEGYRILDTVCISDGLVGKAMLAMGLENIGSDHVLVRITRNAQ